MSSARNPRMLEKRSSFFVALGWCVPVFLLVVPYATGYVAYQVSEGKFPISSAVYASVLCSFLLLRSVFKRPVLPASILFLLGLLALRVADGTVLGRTPDAFEWDPRFYFGFGLIFTTSLVAICGDARTVRMAAAICAILTVALVSSLNIWEWGHPGYYSTVPGRSAGWLTNSNDSSMSICLSVALLLVLRLPQWLNFAVIALGTIGVYTTLSRGNMLIWILICATTMLVQGKKTYRTAILLGVASLFAAYIIAQRFEFQTTNESDLLSRQLLVRGRSSVNISSEERLELLMQGIEGIRQNPISGYGTGSSMGCPYQPHNELVAIWLDNGLLGLFLFLGALISLAADCYKAGLEFLPVCMPLLGEVFFSHNLAESKAYLFVFVFAAALAHFHKRQQQRVARRAAPRLHSSLPAAIATPP